MKRKGREGCDREKEMREARKRGELIGKEREKMGKKKKGWT